MTAPTREEVARGLRAAWIADEPIPSAGTFDDIGPLMRKAWLATADYVLGLIRDETSALRTRVEALTRDRDAATKALVELHRRSEAFGAFVRGEYGITSEDEEDHNVSEFFAAVDMYKEAISALLAIGDAGGGK